MPTMMAVGVASPMAQGQLMTRTEMACLSARPRSPPPSSSHAAKTSAETPITTGTKTELILSAMRCMGGLVELASSTRRTICARVVSSPTRVATMVKYPLVETVAPVTALPGPFSTGTLSPVRADSSSVALPSSTRPSTGTAWPAFTAKTSPSCTLAAGSSSRLPSSATRQAVLGARSIRLVTASVVRPLARASKYLPRVMSVRIMAALSK